jgi:hypothetical protein
MWVQCNIKYLDTWNILVAAYCDITYTCICYFATYLRFSIPVISKHSWLVFEIPLFLLYFDVLLILTHSTFYCYRYIFITISVYYLFSFTQYFISFYQYLCLSSSSSRSLMYWQVPCNTSQVSLNTIPTTKHTCKGICFISCFRY